LQRRPRLAADGVVGSCDPTQGRFITATSPAREQLAFINATKEAAMRKMFLGPGCGLVLVLATSFSLAAGVENKWRLQFSGDAESDGRIVLQVAPAEGDPMSAGVAIAKGRGENAVARDVRDALRAQVGKAYHVEIDDGEDVLVKKRNGGHDFVITIVENSVQGVRINIDAE
jgi:hypothetical protein